jgi:hypothetical protein
MKRKDGPEPTAALPHSERAGDAALGSGGRAAVYRALRDLPCSRCARVIKQGDLFTRDADRATGLPLVRRCRACVPFKTTSGLLENLFQSSDEPETKPEAARPDVQEKVLSRLGPALKAGRRGRGPGGRST